MKISTNSFGNYNPIITQKQSSINNAQPPKVENELKITNEEKKFFTKLYPDETEQINNYHFYNKDGDKNGVSLGSLFDKRG